MESLPVYKAQTGPRSSHPNIFIPIQIHASEEIGYTGYGTHFFPLPERTVIKTNSVVIHQPKIAGRIGMQVKPVGTLIDNPLETRVLKDEFGRHIIPTTNQTATVNYPTKIFILRQFQRNAILSRKLTVATIYDFTLSFLYVIKPESIVLRDEPIILCLIDKKILQPFIHSHLGQFVRYVIIESVGFQIQQ